MYDNITNRTVCARLNCGLPQPFRWFIQQTRLSAKRLTIFRMGSLKYTGNQFSISIDHRELKRVDLKKM